MDLFSVAPSYTKWLRFVYSQLVYLKPVEIFKHYVWFQFVSIGYE